MVLTLVKKSTRPALLVRADARRLAPPNGRHFAAERRLIHVRQADVDRSTN
jgi:hypothetical protein